MKFTLLAVLATFIAVVYANDTPSRHLRRVPEAKMEGPPSGGGPGLRHPSVKMEGNYFGADTFSKSKHAPMAKMESTHQQNTKPKMEGQITPPYWAGTGHRHPNAKMEGRHFGAFAFDKANNNKMPKMEADTLKTGSFKAPAHMEAAHAHRA